MAPPLQCLILEEISPDADSPYSRHKTYLCSPLGGEATPGVEPGEESLGSITRVHWFDLRGADLWGDDLLQDDITYSQLAKIRSVLGYS